MLYIVMHFTKPLSILILLLSLVFNASALAPVSVRNLSNVNNSNKDFYGLESKDFSFSHDTRDIASEKGLHIKNGDNQFFVKDNSIVNGVQKISNLSYLMAAFSNDLMSFTIGGITEDQVTDADINFSEASNDNTINLSFRITSGESSEPEIKLDFLGDGRSLRDLKRMNDKVDPRALSDILRELVNPEGSLFPVFTQIQNKGPGRYKIEKVNNGRLITIRLNFNPEETSVSIQNQRTFTIYIDDLKKLKGNGKSYYKQLKKIFNSANIENWAKANAISFKYNDNNEVEEIYINTPVLTLNNIADNVRVDLSMKLEELVPGELPVSLSESDIFNSYFYKLNQAIKAKMQSTLLSSSAASFFKMLKTNIDYLRALISKEKILAGAYTYLTYFGRDTVISYFLLEEFITGKMKKILMKSLYNRVRNKGQATHEVDSRVKKDNPLHYDTRMADTDFLLSYASLDYLRKSDEQELSSFISEKIDQRRYKKDSEVPMVKDQMADNLIFTFKKIMEFKPISCKYDSDPSSGNWRDALDSLGRLKYPFDINNIWIPMILDSIYQLLQDNNKRDILADLFKGSDLEVEFRGYVDNPEIISGLKHQWKEKVSCLFNKEISVTDLRDKLLRFYSNNEDYLNELKDMPVGYSNINGKQIYTTKDFLNENSFKIIESLITRGMFFLPDGNSFPTTIKIHPLGLDKDQQIVPVMHSDIAFQSFAGNKSFNTDDLLLPFELPVSLGGLAIVDKNADSLSFVVANPMIADQKGYALLTTPDEDANAVDGRDLDVWNLLGKDTYHGWGAVWGVMSDVLMKGLLKKYAEKSARTSESNLLSWLFKSYPTIGEKKNYEVLGFEYDSAMQDYNIIESTIKNIEVNPLQAWNHAGIISTLFSVSEIMCSSKSSLPEKNINIHRAA